MFDLEGLVRKNILSLKPYSSARDDFKGQGKIFLDANENSFGSPIDEPVNRYPDPLQLKLKSELSKIKHVSPENIFIGNGSDEPIDLLFRIFCEPGIDNVLINPPTYGVYEVMAAINNIDLKRSLLADGFQLDTNGIFSKVDSKTKLIFICTPNNPTANSINNEDIEYVLKNFRGIVAIDEAYIDFSMQSGMLSKLYEYPNLVVLQTFSKAWGLAALRVGMAFASKDIISLLNKVKFPYNVNEYSQQAALRALSNYSFVKKQIGEIISEREWMMKELRNSPLVTEVFPSDANFILFRTRDAKHLYKFLIKKNIVVRDRSSAEKCENCLRVTVGTPEENKEFISTLRSFKP